MINVKDIIPETQSERPYALYDILVLKKNQYGCYLITPIVLKCMYHLNSNVYSVTLFSYNRWMPIQVKKIVSLEYFLSKGES